VPLGRSPDGRAEHAPRATGRDATRDDPEPRRTTTVDAGAPAAPTSVRRRGSDDHDLPVPDPGRAHLRME